ncbi:MAG: molybdopterin molybdotransferase MoeA [Bacteroidales bacterium]|nr:molybdopterin molybdotransferase MoeA [Bacteroidales bacterium]
MIPIQEAKRLIHENYTSTKVTQLPINKANGFVLAESVFSPIDTPPFDQSAMDGYAFSFDEWDGKSELLLSGEVQAGNYLAENLKPKEAVRIFTGAAMPAGTDSVVIQENVIKNGKYVSIKDDKLIKGSNVRLQGSQTKKGEITLAEGHYLSPAAISFLAGLGVDSLKVYSNPAISIIVTGKELIIPGEAMSNGKIYESNSFGLTAALEQLDIVPVSVEVVDDDEQKIMNAINNQLSADIIMLSGGVSVGDYDFVTSALEKCGVKKVFHKVKQKPGKPFYFGKHQQTLVFGLPGNPAAVLSCFYEYVVEAIGSFTKKAYFKKLMLPLADDFTKKPGLTLFLKGKTRTNEVSILKDQESYKMNSFAMADCIIELEEDKTRFNKGDLVKVQMIV